MGLYPPDFVLVHTEDVTKRKQYEERLNTLHGSAVKLASAKNFEDIAGIILDTIEHVLGFNWGGVGFVDRKAIRYLAAFGAEIPEGVNIPLDGPGITVRAVKTGRSQLIPDVRLDPEYITLTERDQDSPRMLSELAVPIIVDGRVEMVINLENQMVNAFTEEDQKLLETLAQHIAQSISRLRQVEMLKESEENFKAILEGSMDAVSVIVGLKIVYVNQSYAELLGLADPSEAIGRNALDFAAEEDRKMIRIRALERQRGEFTPSDMSSRC